MSKSRNIDEFEEVVKSLKVELPEGGTIVVRYYPARYTPEFLDRMENRSTQLFLAELLEGTDLTVWKSRLEWHRREIARKKAIFEMQLQARELEPCDERSRLLLEIAKIQEPEPRPVSGGEGDEEVSLPTDAEALTMLHMRFINCIASALTDDQVPNRTRDEDSDSSF